MFENYHRSLLRITCRAFVSRLQTYPVIYSGFTVHSSQKINDQLLVHNMTLNVID